MINYETILSLFDDKLTLLEYLTKIEKALKDSTLTEITIEQPTETTAVFTFVFENGDTIVTPSVTLPRGEKGDTGDKGDKGDKGDTGATGADGTDGISVTNAEINASNHLIITLSNGNTIDAGEIAGIKILDIGSFTISASQAGGKIGNTTITTAQRDILVASYNYILKTTITVAGSSTGTAFYLYRTSGNVYKSLGTTDRYYINISVNSATQSLWYDQGTVQDKNIIAPNATQGQVLTADGSGGASWQSASGGSGKYLHKCHFYINDETHYFDIDVINDNSTKITFGNLLTYLYDIGARGVYMRYPINGYFGNFMINACYRYSNSVLRAYGYDFVNNVWGYTDITSMTGSNEYRFEL